MTHKNTLKLFISFDDFATFYKQSYLFSVFYIFSLRLFHIFVVILTTCIFDCLFVLFPLTLWSHSLILVLQFVKILCIILFCVAGLLQSYSYFKNVVLKRKKCIIMGLFLVI